MGDLQDRNLILAKGFLFLLLGVLAAAILLIHAPSITVAVLLALAIWAFCRIYYFAFYGIEHYVDSRYHFSGLCSFLSFFLRARHGTESRDNPPVVP
ncbi:MAG: hypothetical protein AB7O62_00505 [Pirellulales bacterium]